MAAIWYAINASTEAAEGLAFLTSGERYGHVTDDTNFGVDIGFQQPASSVFYFRREALAALSLLQFPSDQVNETLAGNWNDLIDPATSTEDLAGWFGISVPEMSDADDMGSIPCP